jgi:hypothetical protein
MHTTVGTVRMIAYAHAGESAPAVFTGSEYAGSRSMKGWFLFGGANVNMAVTKPRHITTHVSMKRVALNHIAARERLQLLVESETTLTRNSLEFVPISSVFKKRYSEHYLSLPRS